MRHLKTAYHPSVDKDLKGLTTFTRKATRAIVIKGSSILLLYTERYNDYTLPGGGVDEGEDLKSALIRELSEETGAQDVQQIEEFGIYEEYRPWYKKDYDVQHMISYCFTCKISDQMGSTSFESYEASNGMKPVWLDINKAIEHNEVTLANSTKKGLSIERETFLLKLILKELVNS